jgi:hypothetical protein
MINNCLPAAVPLNSLGGKTLTVVPKRPWERCPERAGAHSVCCDGPKRGGAPLSELQKATETAEQCVLLVARLVTDVARVYDYLTNVLSEEQRTDIAVQYFENVRKAMDMATEHLLGPEASLTDDVVDLFTITPPERVQFFGQVFDNAHAAARHAIPGLIDHWSNIRSVLAAYDPMVAAVAFPECYLKGLQQLPSTSFEELLLQIRREHVFARERLTSPAPTAAARPPVAHPHWSWPHSKKDLADFFGETVRTLLASFESTGIRYQKQTRERYVIDLDTLHPDKRRRFQAELERD